MRATLQQKCQAAMCVGAAIALTPAAATLLIASSRAILINVIANGILHILTLGTVGIRINAPLIEVPFLWKVSLATGILGGSIVAIAGLILLCNAAYRGEFDSFAPSL
jgi:hypothetical protein